MSQEKSINVRCEAPMVAGDPTGEDGVLCNAPAEYCPVCEMNICAGCHSDITGACVPHVRKQPAAVVQDHRNVAGSRVGNR